jgi:hypothetical protein
MILVAVCQLSSSLEKNDNFVKAPHVTQGDLKSNPVLSRGTKTVDR